MSGIKLRKASLAGDTWWSEQWMKALVVFMKPRLLERARKAAEEARVLSLQIDKGFAEALVQGPRRQPYKVEIGLPMLSQRQARRVADTLITTALYIAKILAGELPHDVAALFEKAGTPLFPASSTDIASDCSCDENNDPCQHIGAVYYILGQEFDRDPFQLLEMRGLSRSQLLIEIQLRRAEGKPKTKNQSSTPTTREFPAQTILSANLNDFYNTPKNHSLAWERAPGFLDPLPPSGGRIRELGSPPFWQSDYDFQEVLKAMYLMVRKETERKS